MLVATPEKVLSLEAVGWRDVAKKKAMSTDAVFWIASQTKPVTGVAVMILVDEGKIKVDDPVAKYLPEFKDLWVLIESDKTRRVLVPPRRAILVRDLLTHTRGLPAKSAIEEPTLDLVSIETRIKSYPMVPLVSEPGESGRREARKQSPNFSRPPPRHLARRVQARENRRGNSAPI